MSMEQVMPIKFDKLRQFILKELGMSLNQFLKETKVSSKTFWLMENEGKYSGATIQKILDYLNKKGYKCQPNDIMEYVSEHRSTGQTQTSEAGRSYRPLRVALANLYLELKDLERDPGINSNTRQKIENNDIVEPEILEQIIQFLRRKGIKNANFDDVVEFVEVQKSFSSPAEIAEKKETPSA